MMKLQRDIPTEEGLQFVVIWEHSDRLWTDTCKIENGKLLIYQNHNDEFEVSEYTGVWQKEPEKTDTWFMVKKDTDNG